MTITMRLALAGLLLGVAAGLAGYAWLGRVEALAERTDDAVAVYNDGMLTYRTSAGETVSIPQSDSCKRYSKPPNRVCRARFANGDEVVVTFDSANPTRTWLGPTPGGMQATALFWGGIALAIFGLLWAWFASPLYRRIARPHIPGEGPRPAEE